MAKKVYAVTNVRHDGDEYAAGSELDASLFSKEQLTELYDAGAVELRDEKEAVGPDTSVVPPKAVPDTTADDEKSDAPKSEMTSTSVTPGTPSAATKAEWAEEPVSDQAKKDAEKSSGVAKTQTEADKNKAKAEEKK